METRASWRFRQLITTPTERRNGLPADILTVVANSMLIMRMIFILLTAGMLQVHATGLSQTVTLHGENMKLEKILSGIKKQTGYLFFYDRAMIADTKPVTVHAENAPLENVLKMVLGNQPLNYSIENKTIFITRRISFTEEHKKTVEQQADPITGVVRDSSGLPIAGATILVRESKQSVKTDEQGRFSIQIENGQTLIITHVNMQPLEMKVGGQQSISIRMRAKINELEEVAVGIHTGYQVIPKSQITGAATVISRQVYDQRVAVTGNFLESLEGKIPGLVYNGQSGELSIRGVSSFNAVKKPLIVIDGFPSEIDINTINPNDIVSVSVLRDAAATSVYGVRASNGVIVVETRRGKTGAPVFSLRGTYAVQNKPDFNYLRFSPTSEFAQIQYTYKKDVENIPGFIYDLYGWPIGELQSIVFDVQDSNITEAQAQTKIAALGAYDNMNDYANLFYQARQAKQIDFDVSGGNDKSSYLLGINYVNETPTERLSGNDRIMLNMANTYSLSNRMKLDFRGTYTHTNAENGTIPSYNDFLPYDRLTDESGKALPVTYGPMIQYIGAINKTNNDYIKSVGLYDQLFSPYAELNANTTKSKRDDLRFQLRLNTKITDWLSLDLGGAYENETSLDAQLRTEDAYEVRRLINWKAKKDPLTGTPLFTDLPRGNFYTRLNSRGWNYTARGQLNFNYISPNAKHDISGIAGIEQRKQTASAYKSTIFGYDGQSLVSKPVNLQAISSSASPEFEEVGNGSIDFFMENYFGDTYSDRRFMSYYSEGTYMYDRKLIASASVRLDQSNLFGTSPQYRNKPFWSVGLGWIISQESFLSSVSWLDDLKLRASYGFNGNVPTSDNGPFLILQSGINSRLITPELYNDILSPENQSIRWETTKNYNLGLDYTLLHNRIIGTIDLYYKNARDVFGQFSADPTSGFNQYNANTASILNRGLEIGINSVNIKTKKFSWRTGITASFNQNEVTEVKESDNTSTFDMVQRTNIQKGYPIDGLLSYNYAGLNELGQPLVFTQKGEKVLMDFALQQDVSTDDLIYSGTTTPKYVLGFNNQFTIGSFDLSFLFMYYGGHVMRVELPDPDKVYTGRTIAGSSNYWKKTGDELNTNIPGLPIYESEGDFTYAARAGYIYADQFVRKADYIRLRDLILTYRMRSSFLTGMGLNNIQLRAQAQNLWRYTFSGNDIDPDAINRGFGNRMLENQPFFSFSVYTNF